MIKTSLKHKRRKNFLNTTKSFRKYFLAVAEMALAENENFPFLSHKYICADVRLSVKKLHCNVFNVFRFYKITRKKFQLQNVTPSGN